MPNLTMVTTDVDIATFHAGIFLSEANLLSPVVVNSRPGYHQSLENCFEEQRRMPKDWMSCAGPAGIGQYSIKKGQVGLVARISAHYRQPNDEEMKYDFRNFGEQVLGPQIKRISEEEKARYKGNVIFTILGEPHFFVGPPRIISTTFVTRVFPGELPSDISNFVKEVDEASKPDSEMRISQGYQFLHAKDGKMMYLSFSEIENYDPEKLKLFGIVEIKEGRMTYFPEGDRSHPIDFSENLKV